MTREKLAESLDSVFPSRWTDSELVAARRSAANGTGGIRLNGVTHDAGHHTWPALLPITTTLPPVEPFAPELLPTPLRAYVLDVADRQQAPVDFAAVAAICGLAAVV